MSESAATVEELVARVEDGISRTGAREAEGSGLLSRPAGDRRVGSNPTPSASESERFSGASGQREVGPAGNEGRRSGSDQAAATSSVWMVCVPDYDNYDFDLYATREAALAAIKAQVGDEIGDWSETFDGRQIEFQGRTPVRRLPTMKQIWSLEEVEVHG